VNVGPIDDFVVRDEANVIELDEVIADDEGWVDLRLTRRPVGPATVHCHYGCYPRPSLRDRDQRPVVAFTVLASP
jgi:hypothetical protein